MEKHRLFPRHTDIFEFDDFRRPPFGNANTFKEYLDKKLVEAIVEKCNPQLVIERETIFQSMIADAAFNVIFLCLHSK